MSRFARLLACGLRSGRLGSTSRRPSVHDVVENTPCAASPATSASFFRRSLGGAQLASSEAAWNSPTPRATVLHTPYPNFSKLLTSLGFVAFFGVLFLCFLLFFFRTFHFFQRCAKVHAQLFRHQSANSRHKGERTAITQKTQPMHFEKYLRSVHGSTSLLSTFTSPIGRTQQDGWD